MRRIPEGWAVDARGRPTTDPEAALAGIIQPMAGHKGYAISVVMDMLSGILTGSRAGHLLIALNVEVFQPRAAFEARMEAMIAGLKSVERADGCDEIFYPGEIEARTDDANRRDGLLLPADTLADLAKLAGELGIEALGSPV